jgi:hypothetical protein
MEMGGKPTLVQSIPLSHDSLLQENLWNYSEKIIGEKFKI